jgi:glutathione S-transferase
MTVIVHGVVGSPYLRAALLGLEERGVRYQLKAIPLGAHLEQPHLSRHPFGRVPAFEHDGFALYETQAILRYIAKVFPGPALVPADPRQAARMDQLIGITDWYFLNHIGAPITRPRFVEMMGGPQADAAVIAAALPKARICLKAIDDLKGEAPFLAGDALSLADLQLAPHMAVFARVPEGRALLTPHPGLRAWLERMLARPSMIATDPAALQRAA